MYRFKWGKEYECAKVRDTRDISTNGRAVFFDMASWAFDVLIIEHGFTYDHLMKIWRESLKEYTRMGFDLQKAEMQGWLYFIRLRMRVRRKTILKTGERRSKEELRQAIPELSNYYTERQAEVLINYYYRNRENNRMRKERQKEKRTFLALNFKKS